jgi:hypothetical protein
MLAAAWKLAPQLVCFAGIVLVLLRGFSGRRTLVAASCACGLLAGALAAVLLFRCYASAASLALIRDLVGASFLFLCAVSVSALYRGTGRAALQAEAAPAAAPPWRAGTGAALACFSAAAIMASRLPGVDAGAPQLLALLLLLAAGALLILAALVLERKLPASFTAAPAGVAAAVVALLLFSSSSIIRLDIFSPLTMKVMKFTHDFVHQFFESMLIPDHLFIRSHLWDYIGLLFGKEVGFWGGLAIWFTPAALILMALSLEPLPRVSHIRQGAQRRRLLAAAIRGRRLGLALPFCAVLIQAGAVYRSRFPSVEYWDPKPVPVQASAAGEIVIPKKGADIDLEDGRVHKYLLKHGGSEVRFFVLMAPNGRLTVDLDACAICKPDGYGQAEGTVICYYCNTLIPLETVGKPGGCNPVPARFTLKEDGVHLDALSLANLWNSTVQSTARVKEGGK